MASNSVEFDPARPLHYDTTVCGFLCRMRPIRFDSIWRAGCSSTQALVVIRECRIFYSFSILRVMKDPTIVRPTAHARAEGSISPGRL